VAALFERRVESIAHLGRWCCRCEGRPAGAKGTPAGCRRGGTAAPGQSGLTDREPGSASW
jgi:hypothetical protein